MKFIYRYAICALLTASTFSCSESWLDLQPSDGIPADEAIVNLQGANAALIGVYDGIQGSTSGITQGYSYYGARMIYYGDVRGDDMQATSETARTGASYMMNYNKVNAPQIWLKPYNVIRRANSLIAALDGGMVKDAKEEVLNDIKGQALMARALGHFDILRVYSLSYDATAGTGMGIPIVLTPEGYNFKPGRSTIAEVYNQIIKDLKESINLMKADQRTGYFNQWAAKALLSRVYLYIGTAEANKNAYNVAVDVITNSPYKLWDTSEYSSVWERSGTSEVMFEIINKNNDDWVDRESIGSLYAESGYADAIMTKAFVNLISADPNDIRLTIMLPSVEDPKAYEGQKVFINKYPGRADQGNDVRLNNLGILRLSETYLIAAEAANKLGDLENAAKYLNAIVLRANPKATPILPSGATLDRILTEKRKEFVGEGHRFFDLMRNNLPIVRFTDEKNQGWHLELSKDSRSFDRKYFRAILPIPFEETGANPVLREQQNPGY